jgi:hypothetical protein
MENNPNCCARLHFWCIISLQHLSLVQERGIMINNTALTKWHRANARQLDYQFMNEIIHGINCSPFEAEAIRDKVHEVYDPLMETTNALKPGQIRFSIISAEVSPSTPLVNAKQCLVTLTLDAGEPDLQIRKEGGVIALRRHRFVRICEEAFQQGGLFTLEAMANLFNCAVRTLVDDLAAIRKEGIVPPLRSTVKDMGRAVTHRRIIIEKWLAGKEYSDIARDTFHSVSSVGNYVEKFKRCAVLFAAGFDVNQVAMIARLSTSLTETYQQLINDAKPVPHRKEELDNTIKKNNQLTKKEYHP